MDTPNYITIIENDPPIDELQFCDAEIKKAFEGKSYMMSTPLMAQLIKELRKEKKRKRIARLKFGKGAK